MAMNVDWVAAIGGAVVGWIASSKVDEVQTKFCTTIAAGSAEGVKEAWKIQAKKAKKAAKKMAKKGAGAGNGNGNGKNG